MNKTELRQEINKVTVRLAQSTSHKDYLFWKRILLETEKEYELVSKKDKRCRAD